ncbi:RNA polymerase sigma-I factor [Pullulanibacillus camelliae]|nr:RNA polymerase sigma-I factor [Pullulanibacillus camelliae]
MTKANMPTLTLEDRIMLIQNGDETLRNKIIHIYQPFIKKVISKVCNRFIDHSMDEFSIGLFAFNEAINQYKTGQGSKFLTFADMVIRRRIIDFIRKEARQSKNIYLDQAEIEDDSQQDESYLEQKAALEYFEEKQQIEERIEQIEAYKVLLKQYGISFKSLSKHCPKHIDARENAKVIANILVSNEQLSQYLQEKKQLPIKELLQFVSCSRKTIERNRKYIIALSLIYLGQFHALQPYVEPESL